MIICNVPLVALLHVIALAFTFSFMTSSSMETSAFKISKLINKAIPFRQKKRIAWTYESVEVKVVDCWMWVKSWLKCRIEGVSEKGKEYARKNKLKKSLRRCLRYKVNGRLKASTRILCGALTFAAAQSFSFCLPCAKSSLLVEAVHPQDNDKPFAKAWDSDSGKVGIDCRASACMSDQEGDFVKGTLRPCGKKIQTFGGHLVGNIQVGTIEWRVQSDAGDVHTFIIPNSYYVPDGT
jgi:hypothetical protein